MQTSPLPVTVVIPAHDRARTIEHCLDSVRRQSVAPQEAIVVDDASGDDTALRAEAWGARVIRHERNRGAGAARNTGLAAALTPWVAFLDSDDEWFPHHLETLWRLREGHVLVAGSALVSRGRDGRDWVAGSPRARPIDLASPGQLVFPENFIAESSVLVRRDVLLEVGGYDTSLPFAEDFDLWLRALERGRGVVTPAVTLLYHRVGTGKSADPERPLVSQREIVERYRGRDWWSETLLERRLGTHAWDRFRHALSAGRRWQAAKIALGAARHPRRMVGVALTLLWRFRRRRRAARYGRDGSRSVAVLPGRSSSSNVAELRAAGRTVRDLSEMSPVRALVELAARPPGEVMVTRRYHGIAARCLGAPELERRESS